MTVRSLTRQAAALVALVLLCLWPGRAAPDLPETGMYHRARAEKDFEAFRERFPVALEWPTETPPEGRPDGNFTLHAPTWADLADYLPALTAELGLYPAGVLERTGLQRIVLSRGLRYRGAPIGGIAQTGTGTLYLNVVRLTYAVRTIHHEIAHLIQEKPPLRGSLRAWTALNPEGVEYLHLSYKDYMDTAGRHMAERGFITIYARRDPKEDQAEIFEYLVLDQRHVEELSKWDPVLRAKSERMKSLLEAFDPGLNAAFWERLRGRRPGEALP